MAFQGHVRLYGSMGRRGSFLLLPAGPGPWVMAGRALASGAAAAARKAGSGGGRTGAVTRGRAVQQMVSYSKPAVMVVESPTKAKKIQGFLGDQYLVSYRALRGHDSILSSRS